MQQIISQPQTHTTHLSTHQSILPKPEIESAEQVGFCQQFIQLGARNFLHNFIEVLFLKLLVFRRQQQQQ